MSTSRTTVPIQRISHVPAGAGAADFTLALEVAYGLHTPAGRAPEVATTPPTSLGTTRRTKARSRHYAPSRAA
ncbi:hypothetical protein [Streptomyces sp. NPDC047000]|uniref:hypothetical protein n=1 Tax=Streptomyces sp. NPDC047000 TaxID=3155474 RepID=UPI0033C6622E